MGAVCRAIQAAKTKDFEVEIDMDKVAQFTEEEMPKKGWSIEAVKAEVDRYRQEIAKNDPMPFLPLADSGIENGYMLELNKNSPDSMIISTAVEMYFDDSHRRSKKMQIISTVWRDHGFSDDADKQCDEIKLSKVEKRRRTNTAHDKVTKFITEMLATRKAEIEKEAESWYK
eukprot:518313_1